MCKVMQGHSQPVTSVSAAADGEHFVTSSSDMTVRLWNVHRREQINIMRLHTAPVQSVKFIPGNNYIASVSNDRDVRIWNPFSGESLAEFSGHDDDVTDVAVNLSTGLVASASADRTARLVKLPSLGGNPGPDDLVSKSLVPVIGDTAQPVYPIRKWTGSPIGLESIAVLPNGRQIAAAGDDGIVRVWDTETGQLQRELTDSTDGLLSVCFSPNGQLLAAAGKDQRVYVWDVSNDRPPTILTGHNGWVTSLAFSSAGDELVAGGFDATMRVWDVKKRTTIWHFAGQSNGHDIEWIRDVYHGSNRIAPLTISGGNAGCVRMWWRKKGPNGQVMGIVRPLEWPPYVNGSIACIATTPNGQFVAAAGWNRPIRVWNTANFRQVSEFAGGGPTVYDLAWYGDEQRLLTACGDGTLRLWDRRNGRETKRFIGHTNAALSMGMSVDLRTIASAGEDGMIYVWPAAEMDPATETAPDAENGTDDNGESRVDYVDLVEKITAATP
jgi:WD40 repeat protein